MGAISLTTDVTKIVDIDVLVEFAAVKEAGSQVDVSGRLATAEAAADATGGAGPFEFLIARFDEDQTTFATSPGTPNVVGIAPGTTIPPDGASFTSTSLPGGDFQVFAGPGTSQRIYEVTILEGDGQAGVSVNAGSAARFRYVKDGGTVANALTEYVADIDGDGIYGEPEDAFAVAPAGIDLTDPANVLVFEDVEVDSPAPTETVRVEFMFEDADGDLAVGRVAVSQAVGADVDIAYPLGVFTGDLPSPPPGTEVLPGVVQLASTTAPVDFDRIVSIRSWLLADPTPVSAVPIQDVENPGVAPFVIADGDIFIRSQLPGEANVLAETETFSQVSALGAFAFSESVAAVSPLEVPDLLMG